MGSCVSAPKEEAEATVSEQCHESGKVSARPRVVEYSYKDIEKATDKLSESLLLGKGGFGLVYKGDVLWPVTNTKITVAIKILKETSCSGHEQFLKEVLVLGQFSHPNLVRLVGVCKETSTLVYEYLPGGDVNQFLNASNEGRVVFDWKLRLKVATDAARGLSYMHEQNLIHRDFKPHNLLLDKNLTSKISDFGFVRIGPNSKAHRSSVQTRVIGTFRYLDPAYLETGALHFKCDVYSFGIFLIELLTGARARDDSFVDVMDRICRCTLTSDPSPFLDPKLKGCADLEQACKLAVMACFCIREDRHERPSMRQVVEALEKIERKG